MCLQCMIVIIDKCTEIPHKENKPIQKQVCEHISCNYTVHVNAVIMYEHWRNSNLQMSKGKYLLYISLVYCTYSLYQA